MLGFNHFEEEAHRAKNNQNTPKINEKSYVCYDIDLEGVWKGFWGGFGKPKSPNFAFFQEETEAKSKKIFEGSKVPTYDPTLLRGLRIFDRADWLPPPLSMLLQVL